MIAGILFVIQVRQLFATPSAIPRIAPNALPGISVYCDPINFSNSQWKSIDSVTFQQNGKTIEKNGALFFDLWAHIAVQAPVKGLYILENNNGTPKGSHESMSPSRHAL